MDWLPSKDTKWITGLLITILPATLGTLQQDCSNSNQLAEMNARIDGTNSRIDKTNSSTNARIDGTNARIDETNSSTNARIDETNARIDETNKILVELTTTITRIAADVAVLVGRSNRQEQADN